MTNTKLWDSVFKTDPAHAKKFTKAGGFSGTAIKPFYLIKKATEVFGVCGIGWGWIEIENQFVAGVWLSKVELWYIYEGKTGKIQQWGQTVMVGKNSKGEFVDEEAPKKAITDAVTKCLSYLGFAGDVHMGRFDDSKYIDEREKEEAKQKGAKEVYGTHTAMKKKYEEILDLMDGALTHDQLKEVWTQNFVHIKAIGAMDEQFAYDLNQHKEACKAKITEDEANQLSKGR